MNILRNILRNMLTNRHRNKLRKLLITLLVAVLKTDANIEIWTERNTVELGAKYTLTCKVEEYSSIVTWMLDDNKIPIAKCLRHSCSLHDEYIERYQFTHDEDRGIYNLTIINVTKTDIGGKYMCSNGYDSVSKILSFNDYKASLFEDTENEVITAISGCIFRNRNVMFKWMKINVIDNQESALYPQLLYTYAIPCSNVSVFSTNQQIQHLVAIFAKPSDDGKYFLKSTVTFENSTIVSTISTLKYKFEDQDVNSSKGSDDREIVKTDWLIIFIVALFMVFLIAVVIFCIIIRVGKVSNIGLSCMRRCQGMKQKRPKKELRDYDEKNTKSYVQSVANIQADGRRNIKISKNPIDKEGTVEEDPLCVFS